MSAEMEQEVFNEDSASGSPESQIIGWINQLDFSSSGKKVTLLRKIQEVLVHQCPQALPVYLDDILCHINDRNQDVKKHLTGFMEEASKIKVELLPRMLGNLQLLLMDASAQVQKRVIQAASIVYKNAFVWICSSDQNDGMEKSWDILNHIKLNILNMVDCENEGIRTNSIKFLEGIIILQTYRDENSERKIGDFSLDDIPPNLDFIQRRKLEEESNHIFNLLLKFHNSQHISGVNLMACMSALCEIAKVRPKFLPKVIQALSTLNSSLPPTLSQSQANSVKKHLKMQIVNLVKHSTTSDMLPHLFQILQDLGMTSQELSKVLPKGERKNKRLFDLRNGEGVVKRPRIDSPQSNSQSSDKSDVSAHFEPAAEAVAVTVLENVTEKSLLDGLQNIDYVSNLVMATMKHLPDEMPKHFPTLYEPISSSGVIVQHASLAKLLLHVIKLDSKDGSVADTVRTTDDDERLKLKNALAKLESSKLESKIESVLSKMIDDRKEESVRDKEVFNSFEKDKTEKDKDLVCPPTPTIPKLKQRLKTIKLHEVTKPLTRDVKEKLITGAVDRVLRSERAAQEGGASASRMKMLATFAVSFSDQVRESILSFILDDVASRIDLALAWLYEEYCFIQGFNKKIGCSDAIKIDEKSFQNYNNVLCALITDIAELSDPAQEILREKLFRRIYLDAPFITGDALQYLKQISTEPDKSTMGLNLLKDLIIYHPPKASTHISALLPLTVIKNNDIRETAIEKIVDIYKEKNESLKKVIDKHAYLHLGFIALPDPPRDLMDIGVEKSIIPCMWDDDLYKICLQLYLSLLPYNDELLSELCRVYISVGADGKRCVLRLLEAPIRLLGHDNVALLSLIEECPKGAETLVTRVIHILTEKASPSPELVSRVRDLYVKKVPDVRFLIPVINGLTKAEILSALPKLIKLNNNVIREAFKKILYSHNTQGEQQSSPVTPAELLVALHLLDTTKTELKYIIKATSLCFAEKQIYTSEVLGDVLHELVDQPQLPVLLMRSVLQAITMYPMRMSSLVIGILHRLIGKQVWEEKVVWVGFLKCCQKLNPQSLNVVMMLPPEQLQLLLTTCPDIHMSLIRAMPNMNNVPSHISKVLADCGLEQDMNTSGNIEVLTRSDAVIDVSMPNEPLPPGMD